MTNASMTLTETGIADAINDAGGRQLASYAWGAANVIFIVGVQKLVPTLAAGA
jgi:hypothetical protein